MLEPEAVVAILRLKELGWGSKRIARELGVSRTTVRDYVAAGGWTPSTGGRCAAKRWTARRHGCGSGSGGIVATPT